MPVPKPSKGEKQDKFHSRCMGDSVMMKEYPDQKQRNAICYSAWENKGKKPKSNMAMLVANVDTTDVKKRKWKGREHYVAPAVMAVPGVMNRLLYTAEELAKHPAAWDGRPFTLGHPTSQDGQFISANSDDVDENAHIGFLRGTVWDSEEQKLKTNTWLDIEHTKATRPELLDYYEGRKEGLEVSTGLFGDIVPLPQPLTHNDEEYEGLMTNIKPDHFAALPGGTGACNWQDGCGLRANEGEEEKWHTLFFNEAMSDSEIQQAIAAALRKMAGKDTYYYIEAVYPTSKEVVYEKEVLEKGSPGGDGGLYRVSYDIGEDGSATLTGLPVAVRRKVSYEPITTNQEGDTEVGEKDKKKLEERVDGLIACQRCSFTEEHREWLLTLNEEQLDAVTPPENVIVKPEEDPKVEPKVEDPPPQANQAPQPKTAAEWLAAQQGMPDDVRDAMAEALATNAQHRADLIKTIVANKLNKFTAERLATMSTPDLKNLAELAAVPNTPPAEDAQNFGLRAWPFSNQQKGDKVEPLVVANLEDEIKKQRGLQ